MITSDRNPKVAAALRLHKRAFRERDRAFLVEGLGAVEEALTRPGGVTTLFCIDPAHPLVDRAGSSGTDVVHVSEDVMKRLTGTVTPQGLVAVSRFVDVPLDGLGSDLMCVALLHAVRDPGNAGTVLRSVDAAGADAVLFSAESVDAYNAKTVRASAGSLFHVPLVREVDTPAAIETLRARGVKVLAMDASAESDLHELDLTDPVAFVFGNEAWGLPDEIAPLADVGVRIPIAGRAESLNLAAAATVCVFEWARQQREGRRAVLETLIAAAAHDIRSPLTAMKGFGHSLSTRWDRMTPEQRDLMLRGIVVDADRMNSIVRQLVDAARLTAGRLELFPERTDVGDLVRRVAASLERNPDHPPVAWDGGEVVAFVDPERLTSVVEAFVESLVWWTSEGPVHVVARLERGRLALEARRHRTDLTQEQADGLFRPRAPGTGAGSKMGLFVALGIAEAQGGTVAARVGDSLCFSFEVPVEG
ncbi:MAG TPA: TrmH family RNA methyltransferase [Actinomycetota bacterium]|nr:TrmH family RNA methyltransferase [Actinomycetota bacterium]